MIIDFKQKTAYELRISGWRSDVRSSALRTIGAAGVGAERRTARAALSLSCSGTDPSIQGDRLAGGPGPSARRPRVTRGGDARVVRQRAKTSPKRELGRFRSEEHTSELQSIMRIMYADF